MAQKPAVYRFSIGDVQVTALSDGSVPLDLPVLLRGASRAEVDTMLARSFTTNPVEVSINAFLLDLKSRKVLVDTDAGDLFGSGNGGKLLEALALAGTAPTQITDILLSHIHADHSGGLVRGGKIIFENATVHVGKPDLAFFLDKANARRTGYDIHHFDRNSGVPELDMRPSPRADRILGRLGITRSLVRSGLSEFPLFPTVGGSSGRLFSKTRASFSHASVDCVGVANS